MRIAHTQSPLSAFFVCQENLVVETGNEVTVYAHIGLISAA